MDNFKLHSWQQVVIDHIESFDDLSGSEELISLSDYDRNRVMSLMISMPDKSGHTTLASFIAFKFPSVIIYTDVNHYKEIEVAARAFTDGKVLFDPQTSWISIYEIFHDMITVNKSKYQSDALIRLKERFGIDNNFGKVVAIDKGADIAVRHPEIVDWVYQVSAGPVVLLG